MALSGLASEVKELGELDCSLLSDTELSELMVELHRLRAALDAQHARIGAAWNTRSVWAADGARSHPERGQDPVVLVPGFMAANRAEQARSIVAARPSWRR